MGGTIRWRFGEFLFGKDFNKEGDPYEGLIVFAPYGEEVLIGGMGSSTKFTREYRNLFLGMLSEAGYKRARELRGTTWWEFDLTKKPYKRKKNIYYIQN